MVKLKQLLDYVGGCPPAQSRVWLPPDLARNIRGSGSMFLMFDLKNFEYCFGFRGSISFSEGSRSSDGAYV